MNIAFFKLLDTRVQNSKLSTVILATASSTVVSIILIAVAAILTGLNIFNKIGKFAGAGSLIPITGFANSIVSPAIEYKSEGYVMGVGAKMFTVAGPVLVYGIGSSVIIGIVYYIVLLIQK